MSVTTAEETAKLLASHNEDDDESYFVEYAIQKEIINRNRCPPSRRLLSQVAFHPETNATNNSSNQQSTTKVCVFLIKYMRIFFLCAQMNFHMI